MVSEPMVNSCAAAVPEEAINAPIDKKMPKKSDFIPCSSTNDRICDELV
jgi:hypothetical protein